MKSNPIITVLLRRCLPALMAFAALSSSAMGQDKAGETTKEVVDASPDEKYAFLYTEAPDDKNYDLIDQKSGKKLLHVAGAEMAEGPGRFQIDGLLWKDDSKAFALTVWLEHRASTVLVFIWKDGTFHKVAMPELLAEIPAKVTKGKGYGHVVSNHSQSATEWKKNGSLIVEIENSVDGENGTASAWRTVELSFDGTSKAKIAKSSIKYAVGKAE